jgi:Ni/Co efflux regulator RcnB
MKLRLDTRHFLAAAIAAASLISAPAMADEHDHGKGKGHDKKERRAEREEVREGAYFREENREAARRYYAENYGHGGVKHCPPGLAKKNNGCMPPGQARKWAVGQPIPRGVVVYEVPRPVLVQLPPPPVGYRYERVGGDIVLVRINGRVVVDIMLNVFG